MILADKIINERKKNGWSQEELADMLNVSRQSISKWEGAQAIPDLQKVIMLADVFGVSTDYLLKEDISAEDDDQKIVKEETVSVPPLRKVSMEEANEYLSIRKWQSPKIAFAVSLLITCPVMLLFLVALSNVPAIALSENAACGIGITILFLQIAAAVFILITASKPCEKYDFLESCEFETQYGVSGMLKERRDAFNNSSDYRSTIGVMLCILCPVPVIISAFMNVPEYVIVLMVCVLLIMVAAGVYLLTSRSIISDSFKILLQEEDYTSENKKRNQKVEPIRGIYWALITAAFLAWGFITNDWHITWIIWPIAAVAYAGISGILKLCAKVDK